MTPDDEDSLERQCITVFLTFSGPSARGFRVGLMQRLTNAESGLGALAMLFPSFGLNSFNTSPASEYAREIPVFELLDTFSVQGRSLWQVEARSQGGTWQVWWAGLRDARWDASSTTARNKFPSSYLLQRLADAR